jgi:hypothetical protein
MSKSVHVYPNSDWYTYFQNILPLDWFHVIELRYFNFAESNKIIHEIISDVNTSTQIPTPSALVRLICTDPLTLVVMTAGWKI